MVLVRFRGADERPLGRRGDCARGDSCRVCPCDSRGRALWRGAGRAPGLLPGGDGIALTVCSYNDIPVEVRPVDLRVGILESAQRRLGRVAVGICRPDFNDATGWHNPAQERRAGSGGAAMVPDLENIALQVITRMP
ncbi:MAG: hypothetical protein WCP70_13900 [Methanothrix sp.]